MLEHCIDCIVQRYYNADDEDEKDSIVNSLTKDIFGVVKIGDQIVLCREDFIVRSGLQF